MSLRSDLEKAWLKCPEAKGLVLPVDISLTKAEERIEQLRQQEIQRIISKALIPARKAQALKLDERKRHEKFCLEWNKHYLSCVHKARQRLGLNDQEPICSTEINKEMEPFRPWESEVERITLLLTRVKNMIRDVRKIKVEMSSE
jgi:hypothetical protein